MDEEIRTIAVAKIPERYTPIFNFMRDRYGKETSIDVAWSIGRPITISITWGSFDNYIKLEMSTDEESY